MCLKLCLKQVALKALSPDQLHEQFTASSASLGTRDYAQAFTKVLHPMSGIQKEQLYFSYYIHI